MKRANSNYNKTLKQYILFLKRNKLYEKRKIFFYENSIEKLFNWTNVDFKKTLAWYNTIKRQLNLLTKYNI